MGLLETEDKLQNPIQLFDSKEFKNNKIPYNCDRLKVCAFLAVWRGERTCGLIAVKVLITLKSVASISYHKCYRRHLKITRANRPLRYK